ncbi:MAG TPA: protein kinase [Candidatus Eisenbacteria bacterium]
MAIASGASIGPYKVDREIGRGGMGVVFLAHDTRLGRTVALKALPEDVAADPEHLQRFEREARVLASLNHPNVAAIYGLEESEGRRYLALEHIEGKTLADRIARGPLPLQETLDICIQIAAGVEAAHDGGVVHRDLKPSNVMITHADQAKVLDFGLAKGRVATDESGLAKSPALVDSRLSSPTLLHSPTLVSPATIPGVILGTAAYLSPEQARGKVVDRRTDIWSFGCILYECITGKRAFEGETVSDTIAKTLEREMDWSTLPKSTPPRLRELLERCLTKDPKLRLRDIGEARLTLEEVKSGRSAAPTDAVVPGAAAARRRTAILVAIGAILSAVLGALAWNAFGPSLRSARMSVVHLSLPVPPEFRALAVEMTPGGEAAVLMAAPRGTGKGEASRPRLYLRRMDHGAFEPLRGTDGVVSFLVSPDGRWLSFVSALSGQSSRFQLFKMPIDGSSPPIPLVRVDPRWDPEAVWLRSGDFIFSTDGGAKYVRVPASGAASAPVKFDAPGYNGRLIPENPALPGDRGIFLGATWYEKGVFCQGIGVMDLKSGKVKILIRDGGSPHYSPTGGLLFSRSGALLAVPFDLAGLQIKGEPVAIMDGLRVGSEIHARFALASNGTLTYPPGGDVGPNRRLVIVARDGKVSEWSGERQALGYFMRASPDGSRAVVCIDSPDEITELWISERGRPASHRLQARPGADCYGPIWSPDGERIAYFQLSQTGEDGIYVSSVDGTSPPRRIAPRPPPSAYIWTSSWSPNGSTILMTLVEGTKTTLCSIAAIPNEGSLSAPSPLFHDDTNRWTATISPDGRLIAYASEEMGKPDIYVSRWDGKAPVGRSLLVSVGGGSAPRWGREGKQVYYLSPQNKLMAVQVAAVPELQASSPAEIWDLDALRIPADSSLFDILPDGRLLMVQRGEGEDELTRFDVVLNFFDEVKQKMRAAGK